LVHGESCWEKALFDTDGEEGGRKPWGEFIAKHFGQIKNKIDQSIHVASIRNRERMKVNYVDLSTLTTMLIVIY